MVKDAAAAAGQSLRLSGLPWRPTVAYDVRPGQWPGADQHRFVLRCRAAAPSCSLLSAAGVSAIQLGAPVDVPSSSAAVTLEHHGDGRSARSAAELRSALVAAINALLAATTVTKFEHADCAVPPAGPGRLAFSGSQ